MVFLNEGSWSCYIRHVLLEILLRSVSCTTNPPNPPPRVLILWRNSSATPPLRLDHPWTPPMRRADSPRRRVQPTRYYTGFLRAIFSGAAPTNVQTSSRYGLDNCSKACSKGSTPKVFVVGLNLVFRRLVCDEEPVRRVHEVQIKECTAAIRNLTQQARLRVSGPSHPPSNRGNVSCGSNGCHRMT